MNTQRIQVEHQKLQINLESPKNEMNPVCEYEVSWLHHVNTCVCRGMAQEYVSKFCVLLVWNSAITGIKGLGRN